MDLLENLHLQFQTSLNKGTYISEQEDCRELRETNDKVIRLAKVFLLAQEKITQACENLDPLNINKEISQLTSLAEDGSAYYKRYLKSTNTWTRGFFRGLYHLTPMFLKNHLPSFCFATVVAEQETKMAYENYILSLEEQLAKLQELQKEPPAAPHVEETHLIPVSEKEHFIPLDQSTPQQLEQGSVPVLVKPNILSPSLNETTEMDEEVSEEEDTEKSEVDDEAPSFEDHFEDQTIEVVEEEDLLKEAFGEPLDEQPLEGPISIFSLSTVKRTEKMKLERPQIIQFKLKMLAGCIQFLNQSDVASLSLQKYKYYLKGAVDIIYDLDFLGYEMATTDLDGFGIGEDVYDALKDMISQSLSDATENQTILKCLKSTAWHSTFQKALKASRDHHYFSFNIQRIANLSVPKISSGGVLVKESVFKNYQGTLVLAEFTDLASLENQLEELIKLFKYPTFRPAKIHLQSKEEIVLNPHLLDLLQKLSGYCSEIQVDGVMQLHLKDLEIPLEEELVFVQKLNKFHFPDLQNILLLDTPKTDWTHLDFCLLLLACPTVKMLKTCYDLSTSPTLLFFPPLLMKDDTCYELDCREFHIEDLPSLLEKFSKFQSKQPKKVDLRGHNILDFQLIEWIQKGYFKDVQSLNLHNCSKLTTDILKELVALNQLSELSLPDLAQGEIALSQLPRLDNPFKIKLFYISSKVTQSLACQLYTGPCIWASIFQIPLVRKGVPIIFNPQQKVLDPKSVACWIYQGDYVTLADQPHVIKIIADSNPYLNDSSLVEFVKKFPKAESISLFNCPCITNEGIQRLLLECPHIRYLDLTSCPQIDELFLYSQSDKGVSPIKQLNQLIVTNTKISPDVARSLQGELGEKLVFQNISLKITNEQLKSKSLEQILNAQPSLNRLRCIDLSGCSDLTDAMLGILLERLNYPIQITTIEGTSQINRQRLNLAVLDLSGCVKITDKAFDQQRQEKEGKIQARYLGRLECIVAGGTQISDLIKKDIYPDIIFQEYREPITIQIDPKNQLTRCLDYLSLSAKKKDPAMNVKAAELSASFIHDRIVAELFTCAESPERADHRIEYLLRQPVDTNSDEFFDFTLFFHNFKTTGATKISAVDQDKLGKALTFRVHRDMLYSYSSYFNKRLKPGGVFSKSCEGPIMNQHVNFQSSQAVVQCLYGKIDVSKLDWQIAADAAELIGKKSLGFLEFYYHLLLQRIHSQFDISRADKMLLTSQQLLKDQEGCQIYEKSLIQFIKNLPQTADNYEESIAEIGTLAETYQLPLLQATIAELFD